MTEKCVRTYIRFGKAVKAEYERHSFRWSGGMPNTGMYCCVYCGNPEDETTFNGKKVQENDV